MFPLHDRIRRRIVLAAFGALCVLPTLLILLWGLSRQMPWHTKLELRRLEGVLGVRVRADRAHNTKPGVWCYEAFSLYDPESGRRLFQADRLRTGYTPRRASAPARLTLHAGRLDADPAGAEALYHILSRAMRGAMATEAIDLYWTAEELVFEDGDAAIHLAEFSGSAQSHPGGVKTQVRFRLADGAEAEPAHVELSRNRLTSPAGLELKLYTGATHLPCRLLAVGLPAFRPLAPNSRFRGYLRADWGPHGWRGELAGQFLDVELGRMVRERFAQQLTGKAQVAIEQLRFDGSRIEEAWGSVVLGPGTVGRRLLDAAVKEMHLIQSAPPTGYDDPLPYRQLAADWRIHAGGLHVAGRCDSAGPGTLLVGMEPWLVAEPVVQPVPVAALVRTLVPERSPEVPATRRAEWLLRYLPLSEHDAPPARHSAERLHGITEGR